MSDTNPTPHHLGCTCDDCFAAFKTRFGASLSLAQLAMVFRLGAEEIKKQLRRPTIGER